MRERRNLVLGLMRRTASFPIAIYALATRPPLTVAKSSAQSVDAPYFVDLVDDAMQSKFQDVDLQANAFRIYTTLDLRLQRAAGEAIRVEMQAVERAGAPAAPFSTEPRLPRPRWRWWP